MDIPAVEQFQKEQDRKIEETENAILQSLQQHPTLSPFELFKLNTSLTIVSSATMNLMEKKIIQMAPNGSLYLVK